MSLSDPLGDSLTRIRNGLQARKDTVLIRASNLMRSVVSVLKEEGFIRTFEDTKQDNGQPAIKVELKYVDSKPAILEMQRVSTPGRRVYSKVKNLPRHHNGLGIYILSTPQGVMTDHQARAQNVGGEILAKVF